VRKGNKDAQIRNEKHTTCALFKDKFRVEKSKRRVWLALLLRYRGEPTPFSFFSSFLFTSFPSLFLWRGGVRVQEIVFFTGNLK